MRDFLCKVYDKLYGFLGYTDMRLILGYESGGKGCARISFYIRVAWPPISFPESASLLSFAIDWPPPYSSPSSAMARTPSFPLST